MLQVKKSEQQAPVPPQVIQYQNGEHHRDRHKRRLETNVELFKDEAVQWAETHDVFCRISNRGHHWKFQRNGSHIEWWPESAKCIVNRSVEMHIHEFPQLLVLLEQEFAKKG